LDVLKAKAEVARRVMEQSAGTARREGWTSAGLPLSVRPPRPGLLSYSKWVHATYPDRKGPDLREIKRVRDTLKVRDQERSKVVS
jgi:hypothetical protein